MLPRSTLKRIAGLALAALLFAQAALALAACESVRRAPASALAEHRTDGENCHQQGTNVNLCLAHCLGEDQSLDKPLVKVPALAGAPILSVPMPRAPLRDACAPRHLGVAPTAAPPPRILFQSLLI